jgi:hypothetical protein
MALKDRGRVLEEFHRFKRNFDRAFWFRNAVF